MQIFWFSFLMIFNLIGSYNKHTHKKLVRREPRECSHSSNKVINNRERAQQTNHIKLYIFQIYLQTIFSPPPISIDTTESFDPTSSGPSNITSPRKKIYIDFVSSFFRYFCSFSLCCARHVVAHMMKSRWSHWFHMRQRRKESLLWWVVKASREEARKRQHWNIESE